jgi:hypothetical protein
MNLYYTIVTTRGLQKIEEYYRLNKTVNLTQMGFGGINDDDVNYVCPDTDAIVVPHEWTRIGLERQPEEGFVGGGATINNSNDDHKGHWICNVGIYDEDDELILISAYRPMLVEPDESIVAAYVINIQTVLSNAANVVVVTDTSLTHPTYDELDDAIKAVEDKIPLAASADEVDASENAVKFASPAALNKKGLIKQLQDYAVQAANKVKEEIYGGVPIAALDTIKEVSDALLQGGGAIQSIFEKLGILTTAVGSNKTTIGEHQNSSTAHTPAQVGAAPKDHTHTPEQVGAASKDHTHTPEQVGAASKDHTHTLAQLGAASDDDLNALAKKVDNKMSSTVTASELTDIDIDDMFARLDRCWLTTVGNVVTLNAAVKAKGDSSGVLFVIPEGARPINNMVAAAVRLDNSGVSSAVRLSIGSSGRVGLGSVHNGETFYLSTTWIRNQ